MYPNKSGLNDDVHRGHQTSRRRESTQTRTLDSRDRSFNGGSYSNSGRESLREHPESRLVDYNRFMGNSDGPPFSANNGYFNVQSEMAGHSGIPRERLQGNSFCGNNDDISDDSNDALYIAEDNSQEEENPMSNNSRVDDDTALKLLFPDEYPTPLGSPTVNDQANDDFLDEDTTVYDGSSQPLNISLAETKSPVVVDSEYYGFPGPRTPEGTPPDTPEGTPSYDYGFPGPKTPEGTPPSDDHGFPRPSDQENVIEQSTGEVLEANDGKCGDDGGKTNSCEDISSESLPESVSGRNHRDLEIGNFSSHHNNNNHSNRYFGNNRNFQWNNNNAGSRNGRSFDDSNNNNNNRSFNSNPNNNNRSFNSNPKNNNRSFNSNPNNNNRGFGNNYNKWDFRNNPNNRHFDRNNHNIRYYGGNNHSSNRDVINYDNNNNNNNDPRHNRGEVMRILRISPYRGRGEPRNQFRNQDDWRERRYQSRSRSVHRHPRPYHADQRHPSGSDSSSRREDADRRQRARSTHPHSRVYHDNQRHHNSNSRSISHSSINQNEERHHSRSANNSRHHRDIGGSHSGSSRGSDNYNRCYSRREGRR